MATENPTPTITKVGKSIKSFMWKFILVLILLIGLGGYWFYFNVYSEGERTGMLTKLSKKGNIFKTYEGEMLIGNFNQAPNVMVPEKFYFSVTSQSLADTLMKVQGKMVSLKYVQYRKALPWRGEQPHIVNEIERIGN